MAAYGINPQASLMFPFDREISETLSLGHGGGCLVIGEQLKMSRKKQVIVTDAYGNEEHFPSVADAAKAFKCKEEHIRRALRGERKTAFGLEWRYS